MGETDETLVVARRRRTWRRAAGQPLPFVPYGLIPLAGLLALLVIALGPFAFGEVQGPTEAATREALRKTGADWASYSVSGQWVVLEGKPPSREEADLVLNAVRQARAPTLLGEAQPATWVYDRFTWTEDPLLPGSGNQPRISADGNGPADPGAAPQASNAPAPTEAEIASCDDTMSRLLSGSTIQFSTASTIVGGTSDAVLTAVAEAAVGCRGVLRIEGHTDNIGRAGYNATLSRRRAEAVREALIVRGVPAARLVAEGFGSQRPIADNRTGEGRAQNRRIEIRTVRPSPT